MYLQVSSVMRRQRLEAKPIAESRAFTIYELTVVMALLAMLTSLAIPPILKWIKKGQVDEAKAILNSAITDCLQEYRINPTAWQNKEPDSLNRQLPGSYQFSGEKKTCKEVAIEDKSSTKSLPDLSFNINTEGKVAKIARIYDPDYENAAKTFGPTSLSSSAIAINACLEQRSTCLLNLNAHIASGVNGLAPVRDWTGECRFPADLSASCSMPIWTFRKVKYPSQATYDKAVNDALGETCRQERQKLITATHTGQTPADVVALGCPSSWWYLGADLGSKAAYDAKVAEVAEARCIADREAARINNQRGKYGPIPGPGRCGEIKWICNQSLLDSEAEYNIQCKVPPPPPPPPPCINPWGCA